MRSHHNDTKKSHQRFSTRGGRIPPRLRQPGTACSRGSVREASPALAPLTQPASQTATRPSARLRVVEWAPLRTAPHVIPSTARDLARPATLYTFHLPPPP